MNRIPHAAELADRRDSPRVDLAGQYCTRLDPRDGRAPVICALIDYSVTGMRLMLPGDIALPAEVDVLIGDIMHTARIVWRQDNTVGVDFLDEHYSIF